MSNDRMIDSLHDHLVAYAAHLDAWPHDGTRDRALALLLERESIARLAAVLSPSVVPVHRIAELDARCQQLAPSLVAAVGGDWKRWRNVFTNSDAEWWWLLDARASEEPPSSLWLTLILSVALAVALALTADVARRFFTGGVGLGGIFGTLFQALLAVLAGSAITVAGRDALIARLRRTAIPPARWSSVRAAIAVGCAALAALFWLQLPRIGRSYETAGVRANAEQRYSDALWFLEHASALAPESPRGHYELGIANESLFRFDDAIRNYQDALSYDETHALAQNNLARVILLGKKEPARALGAIATLSAADPAQRAVLLKNRAWAYMQLGYVSLAERDLEESLKLDGQSADAHCLSMLAQDALCRDEQLVRQSALRCVARAEASRKPEVIAWRNYAKETLTRPAGLAPAPHPITGTTPCARSAPSQPQPVASGR